MRNRGLRLALLLDVLCGLYKWHAVVEIDGDQTFSRQKLTASIGPSPHPPLGPA
jgi:hypothetical protein